MRFNLRDLFWLIFVAAVATRWWIDRSKLADRLLAYESAQSTVLAVRVSGLIIAMNDGDLVEITIGSDDGLKASQRMEVSRGNQLLGEIIVRTTSPDRAVGQIANGSQRSKFRKGDTVTANIRPVQVGG
ncbi:hypothetical protein [Anatilimnocola floriformis]|uniref:hypothetical protein n=1 Tax=Anatilimnocola floriformis TaxID=2948575 RepID=UPI0020C264B3|nr:hypothetical protein [Anatilimnocola floriformis]